MATKKADKLEEIKNDKLEEIKNDEIDLEKENQSEIESQINTVVNTSKSIKSNIKDDKELQKEQMKQAQKIVKSPRKKFKCSSVYAAMFPNGYTTTYQGVIINLIFDNRVLEFPEPIIDFIEAKLQHKADKEAAKYNRFKMKKQEKLGEYEVE